MTKQEMKKEAYFRILMEIQRLDNAKDLLFLDAQQHRISGILRFAMKCGLITKDDYNELKEKENIICYENEIRLKKIA